MNLINDSQSLKGAKTQYGHAIKTYDDGYGPLFIHRDSMGISGIVRAQTWEDAYSICEDEFFPDASMTHDEMVKDFGEDYIDDAAWNESFGFRPNFNGTSSLYEKDLNGDYLHKLTPELLEELQITLEIEDNE